MRPITGAQVGLRIAAAGSAGVGWSIRSMRLLQAKWEADSMSSKVAPLAQPVGASGWEGPGGDIFDDCLGLPVI